jgi:hypothetical protein
MPFFDYKSQRRDAHRRGGGYGKKMIFKIFKILI